jgi:N-formylglutamate amidohydrolase
MLMTPPSRAFQRTRTPARIPVLLSVPHAGRAYAPGLLALARVPAATLALLEDPFVDRLIDGGVAAGAATIVANAPRAEIDLNRALDDLDHGMLADPPGPASGLSRRASAGLGLIPSRLAAHGALWRRGLHAHDVARRVATIYEPYHQAVAETLTALRDRYGVAVLVDCHSMPSRPGMAAGVVLGDRRGETCGEWLIAAAEAACADARLPSVRNDPYAGGEIVKRHGRPGANIHALQIELDRGLYLNASCRPDGAGAARMSRLIAAIVTRAAAAAAARMPLAIAAE